MKRKKFDAMIGRLNRTLSEVINAAQSWRPGNDLDLVDRQTLNRQAKELVDAGEKVLAGLGMAEVRVAKPAVRREPVKDWGENPGPFRPITITGPNPGDLDLGLDAEAIEGFNHAMGREERHEAKHAERLCGVMSSVLGACDCAHGHEGSHSVGLHEFPRSMNENAEDDRANEFNRQVTDARRVMSITAADLRPIVLQALQELHRRNKAFEPDLAAVGEFSVTASKYGTEHQQDLAERLKRICDNDGQVYAVNVVTLVNGIENGSIQCVS